jgi:hypothetical protein
MNDKLKDLNLDPPGPEMRVALDTLVKSLPLMKEYETIQAKVTRSKYEALIEVGFTEAQALELCKKTVS